ncbi:S8 family serine peptidase [Luteolibacter pohnpeiensis]|uniref:S8 family serine peptidase n=1 Tax=Luteolibacter pohnpeiensis TaxID=454153 RepID=A0A934VW80_9BACT|nr:S8 family serine peptidase [Luteolibacter pohnpeiensis]MBK1883010.1 S8 family serine peptidase [Luteolibacter pohnpeiensis]
MRRKTSILISVIFVILCACLGWWLVVDLKNALFPDKLAKSDHSSDPRKPSGQTNRYTPPHSFRSNQRDQFDDGTTVEMLASANPNEAILHFPSADSYGGFLAALSQSKVTLEQRLDPLHAIRISYTDLADLQELLENENITTRSALSRVPDRPFPSSDLEPGAVGFGAELLSWLGITGDHSSWGAGVKVAVLDTGIVPHSTLPPLAAISNIIEPPDNPDDTNGHGTAVASIIAGRERQASGIAPAVDLISIRVSGEQGITDSFSLAAGMLAAIDAGADLINLSLGSYEDSSLIQEATAMVQNSGILIVAAAGNDGQDNAAYPAAYQGVVSVGAVDGRGEHLNFSNFGSYLYITAPGYFINTAWPGGKYVQFSGTSASAPVVTGILAAIMSDGSGKKVSATEALSLLTNYADDAGIPGPDSEYGYGIVDIRRIINRSTPGIVDVAITDQRIVTTQQGQVLQVTIQNRGTQALINTLLDVSLPGGNRQSTITTLVVGDSHTSSIPINLSSIPSGTSFQVVSSLSVNARTADITPDNNQRADNFTAP